jgi:integrase
LIDRKAETHRDHEARPLSDHIDAWHAAILAQKKTARHAEQYRDRATKIVAFVKSAQLSTVEAGRRDSEQRKAAAASAGALRSARLSELTTERIQAALATLLDSGKSPQTVEHYRAAIRAFCIWADRTGRIRSNPIKGVTGYNVAEDVRHERRALTDDELARLVSSTESGPVRQAMTAALRAMAYRVASATGFRVAELRSLTPESFRLDDAQPAIFLSASSTKNRRPAD